MYKKIYLLDEKHLFVTKNVLTRVFWLLFDDFGAPHAVH